MFNPLYQRRFTRVTRLGLVAAALGAGLGCEALQPVDVTAPGDPDGPGTGDDTALIVDSDSGLLDTADSSGGGGGPVTNNPPRANAGQDISGITPGSTVNLNGSGTDLDDDPLTYSWALTTKPPESQSANLANETFPGATLYVDVSGSYMLTLTVNDGKATNSDTVNVAVAIDNFPPVADAGFDQSNVCVGDMVQLSGEGSSDPDGDALSWFWTMRRQPAGSAASLAGASIPSTASRPFFTPDRVGLYSIELIVEDDSGLRSPADTVSVTVRDCSGGGSNGGGSSGGDDCLSCAAETATASAGRFRTGGLAASWGLLAFPVLVLLANRRR